MTDYCGVTVDAKLERTLRDEFTNLDHNEREYGSVIAAMWFECAVSLHMQFTMKAFDVGSGFTATVKECEDTFQVLFSKNRSLSKVEAFEALAPLARFYCSFVPTAEIDIDLDIMPYFEPHPRSESFLAITPQGLAYLFTIVRSYFMHRSVLKMLRWQETAIARPATDFQVEKAVCMLKGRGDSYATDELLDEIRQRVIGRLMPAHAIYNANAQMAIASKDMYLVMREVDPDNLNDAHRQGSTPFLLALQEEGDTLMKEILLTTILLAPTKCKFYDYTYGDSRLPETSPKLAVAYYAGEYALLEEDGTLRHGYGSGIAGAVGACLEVTKIYDKIGYNYVVGTGQDFRPSLHEVEFAKSSCF